MSNDATLSPPAPAQSAPVSPSTGGARRRSAIVVYATTEPAEALVMGGQVLVMGEGQVLQQGPTLAVYRRPASARVALTFSDPPMNMIDGRIEVPPQRHLL